MVSGASALVGLASLRVGPLLVTVHWCCAHNRRVLSRRAGFDKDDDEIPENSPNGRVGVAHARKKCSVESSETYKLTTSSQRDQ